MKRGEIYYANLSPTVGSEIDKRRVQVEQPGVELFRRNQQGQWVLSEYGLGDSLLLESVNVEIAIADLYRQIQFS